MSVVHSRVRSSALDNADQAALRGRLSCVQNPLDLPSPAPGMSAEALADRLAAKARKLQRRHTVADVIRQYVASAPVMASDGGRAAPLRMWSEILGDRFLDEVTTDEVAEALAMYAEQPVLRFAGRDPVTREPMYRSHGTRAPSTVTRAKVVLSAVFTYAKANALLPAGHHSPTAEIRGKGFNASQLPDRSLTPDEVDTLLAHARTAPWDRLYLFVLMALTTGARMGELRYLRGRDLRLDDADPHAIVGLHRRGHYVKTKNSDVKVMPLSDVVVKEIRRWGVPGDDDWLFPSPRVPRQAIDPSASYKALVKRVGLKHNTRFHDLRHTAGTIFANEGRSESEIAALLGHRTLTMVARYSRVQPQKKAKVFRDSALSKLR